MRSVKNVYAQDKDLRHHSDLKFTNDLRQAVSQLVKNNLDLLNLAYLMRQRCELANSETNRNSGEAQRNI